MMKMEKAQLDALRGAYVTIKNRANDCRAQVHDMESQIEQSTKAAERYERMAEATKEAFLKLGGDPKVADNWYSWSYE